MLDKEKNTLLAYGYVIFILLGFFGIAYVSKLVPASIIIGLTVVVLYLYVIPTLIKRYYQMHGVGDSIGFSRFIPIYNEITVLSTGVAVMYVIFTVLTVLGIVSVFLQPAIVAKVFGDAIALQWANGAIVASIFFIIGLSIVKGIGFSAIAREIDRNIKKISNVDSDHFGDRFLIITIYILLFIPILRSISLGFLLDRINKIVLFDKITEEQIDALASGMENDEYEDDSEDYEEDYDEYDDEEEDDDYYD